MARGLLFRMAEASSIFMLGRIFLPLIEALPRSAKNYLYKYCKRYAESCEGINNPDPTKNGELRVIRQFIPRCSVVFDVGAHLGEWAQLVLKYNPAVQLHCFEPSAFTFQKLSAQNFPSNVICNNFGLSSQDGEAKLRIFTEGDGMNSLYQRSGLQDRGIAVQEKQETIVLKTLDGYCEEKNIQGIDFLKIDVEGHELGVLSGSERMLREKRIGIVQFEYGDCNIDSRVLLKDSFEVFKELPYEFYKVLPTGPRRVSSYSQQFENFQYSNWLAIHRESKAIFHATVKKS